MLELFYFAAPLPVLGRLAEIAFLDRYMHALRNTVVKKIAESSEWRKYLPAPI